MSRFGNARQLTDSDSWPTQYDEFDNAALTMIAHSPTAWDHVHFKDVLVKVSNVEVYYKAISFYLAEHPDLLVDMLKVRPL